MLRNVLGLSIAAALYTMSNSDACAQASDPCPRPSAGSAVSRPPDLYSTNGSLKLALNYYTTTDAAGRALFCLVTPNGLQSPTLHVRPGDTLDIAVTNHLPAAPSVSPTEVVSTKQNACGDMTMTETSLNLHYHGTNTSPRCHGDQVIHTIINAGETFNYHLDFPSDEPPGLYWYHPHVHGISEAAVQGGASGAIIVDGIENMQPAVSKLPERVLVIRDQTVGARAVAKNPVPAWDISLNYVPVSYPNYTPAIINTQTGQKEFWRVLNASADTIADVQLRFDGQAQILQLAGQDGVPTGSQDGTRQGKLVPVTHILIPPAGRAEFIVPAVPAAVKAASFVAQHVDTGPDGDIYPERTLAVLNRPKQPQGEMCEMPVLSGRPGQQRFERLEIAPVTARRKLYFSEVISDPSNPASPTNFFITVDGAKPVLFSPLNPPSITTSQGAVEEWTIENRTGEVHEFHMHQIHFELLARNGVPVSLADKQFLDTVNVPYWTGKGSYPSVTVRMDFRGADVGDLVYHCHILGHEDNGMMAIIRVLPPSIPLSN